MKKTLLFVALLAFAALILADDEPTYPYTPPTYPCIFTADVDVQTLLTHNRVKYYVNSHFMRVSNYNHAGVLIADKLYRPDVNWLEGNDTPVKYFNVYTYNSTVGCVNESMAGYDHYEQHFLEYILGTTEDTLLFREGHTFFNKSKGTFKGQEYDVYFDLDMDHRAYYVDTENYIVGMVFNRDIPDERATYTIKWGKTSPYDDYVFQKSFVYNCTDQNLWQPPAKENATCVSN